MTKLAAWKSAVIAVTFLSGGYLLSSLAASPEAKNAGYELTHKLLDFKVGATQLREGDNITIEEAYGTSPAIAPGNMYLIKGTYRLGSQKTATLAAYVTDRERQPPVPNQRTQQMTVQQGEGRFSLIFYMWRDGDPHLSFYPAEGGGSFANLYFGTGNGVLTRGWWEGVEKPAAK